jgi:hypothetical protein
VSKIRTQIIPTRHPITQSRWNKTFEAFFCFEYHEKQIGSVDGRGGFNPAGNQKIINPHFS